MSENVQKSRRKWWYYVLGIGISIASFLIMAIYVVRGYNEFQNIRDHLNLYFLIPTFPIFVVGLLAGGIGWGKILGDLGGKVNFWEHIKIFTLTYVARRIPGSLWYIVGRIAWYEQLNVSKRLVTVASGLETLLILWSGMVVALVLLPFLGGVYQNQVWLFLVGIALGGLLFHPRVLNFGMKLLKVKSVLLEQLRYSQIIVWLLMYIPVWLVGGTTLYFLLRAIHPGDISLLPVCVAAWSIAGVLGLLILVLPAGLGLSEMTITLILSAYVPASVAVTAAVLMRILMTLYEFFFAFLVMVFYRRGQKMQTDTIETDENREKRTL